MSRVSRRFRLPGPLYAPQVFSDNTDGGSLDAACGLQLCIEARPIGFDRLQDNRRLIRSQRRW